MPVGSESLRRLAALGLTGQQMAEVLSIIANETESTGSKSPGAERTRRWRERHQTSQRDVTVTSHVTSQTVTESVTSDVPLARAEPEQQTLQENTKKEGRKKERI